MTQAPIGVLLAAGLGSRLAPLTHDLPKALVTLHGIPFIEFALRNLEAAGCKQIAINTHHHADVLSQWLEDREKRHSGTQLLVFHEEHLLGVGGGLKRMSEALSTGSILVQNADVLHDFPLGQLLEEHSRLGSTLSLVCAGEPLVMRVEGQRLRGILEPHGCTHGFTGVHILSQDCRDALRHWDSAAIIPFYTDWIQSGKEIVALQPPTDYLWADLGHASEYAALHERVWNQKAYHALLQRFGLDAQKATPPVQRKLKA
jgi:mannose-1-phosphate guanylyltransferase